MDVQTRQHIALKTINLLAGEKGEIPSELAIVPLPKMNKVSIVKYIEIPDKEARGDAWDASITIIFEQDFLPYIHKYIDKFSHELDILRNEIIKVEKKKDPDLISKTISDFYFTFEKKVKSYLSSEEMETFSPEDLRLEMLKETIEDFQNLIKFFIEHSEGFSQSDLKDALKLSYELSVLDLNDVSTKKIRQIAKFAEKLRRKKDNLAYKQQKMKQITDRLNNGMSSTLNEKLEEITAVFDEFLDGVKGSMEKLSDKGSSILFYKKIYDDSEAKILATSKELNYYLKFLKQINSLPHYDFVKLKKLYIKIERMRQLKKMREVGNAAQEIATILSLKRKKILRLTRDPKLKEAMDDVFKITIETTVDIVKEEKRTKKSLKEPSETKEQPTPKSEIKTKKVKSNKKRRKKP